MAKAKRRDISDKRLSKINADKRINQVSKALNSAKKENKKQSNKEPELASIISANNDPTPEYATTADIKIPKTIIEQVIGQDAAVEIIKKAAVQKRHVLLIGEPGTGKSMLGLALAELLPKENLKDVLVYPNQHDENNPKIVTVPASQGRSDVEK